jgi:hypothetical protein
VGWDWGQSLQGAGGGAAAGAAFGPYGAAIGAGAGFLGGGLSGYFGGDDKEDEEKAYREQLKQLSAGYGARTAPQAAPAAQASYSGFRQNQAGLIAQLEAMSRGNGPSAAQYQMREAMDRASGAQASAAAGAGGRGVNAGAALRQASNNTAAFNQQAARDTGMMRVQEQLGATNQLGQAVAQGRAGDENLNQFNAQQQNQVSLANVQAVLQQLGLNDEAQLKALIAAMNNMKPAEGTGTGILAGGASAAPMLMQMMQQKNGG